jgi:hypothetical protein
MLVEFDDLQEGDKFTFDGKLYRKLRLRYVAEVQGYYNCKFDDPEYPEYRYILPNAKVVADTDAYLFRMRPMIQSDHIRTRRYP